MERRIEEIDKVPLWVKDPINFTPPPGSPMDGMTPDQILEFRRTHSQYELNPEWAKSLLERDIERWTREVQDLEKCLAGDRSSYAYQQLEAKYKRLRAHRDHWLKKISE